MRIPIPSVLPMCLVLALTVSSSAQDRISWVTDLRVARQMAEQQQRLVLLHFWTETCLPCQNLERQVFNQPELIRALSASYIPVKINADQSRDLAEFYKISAVPTDIIVDPNGRELFRSTSPKDPNKYISMLDGVRANASVGLGVPAESLVSLTEAGASAGSLPREAPRSAYLENPYASAPNQEAPARVATPYEPRYGSAYAPRAEGAGPSPGATDEDSRWQAGAAARATNPANAAPYQPGYDRVSPSLPAMGAAATRPDYAREERPAAAPIPAESGLYTSGSPGSSRWQASAPPSTAPAAAPPGRPWDNNAFVNPANPPAATPPAYSGLAPQMGFSPSAAPPQPQNLALDGFCPVSLVAQGMWSKGDPRWGAVHRGRVYLFSTPQGQQQFLANPDRFSPVLEGNDPVRFAETGQLVAGKREHGVYYGDRIVLFADEDALQRFGSRPDYYIAFMQQGGARSAMGPRQP